MGFTVDAVMLYALLKAGVSPGAAGALSLAVAAVVLRVTAGTIHHGNGWFATAASLTVLLRAGVLAWMLRIPGCPLVLTVVAAALAGGLLMRGALLVEPEKTSDNPAKALSWPTPVSALLIYAVLLRLVYLGLPELIHQEAYYWNYSRHLALSYLDHPPMVAWLIRGFTALLGHTVLGVRAGTFLAWLVGAWFVFHLTLRVYNAVTARSALLLFAALPFYFMSGTFMSPDMPMIACWAASLYFLYRALIDEKPSAWIGAGVFLGLGMLSKYTIVLLGLAGFVFMIADRRARRWFLRPHPWAAAGIVLLLSSPVIVWNFQHDWMSFAFQGPRRASGASHFSLPALLGATAVFMTPVGLAAAAVAAFSRRQLALVENVRSSDRFERGFRLLMSSTFVPLAVFAFFSVFRNTKINWTDPVWLGALPFMAHMLTDGWPADAGRWRAWLSPRTWRTTTVVVLLILGFTLHFLVLGIPGLHYPENKLGFPAKGWPELGEKIETVVDEVTRQYGARPLVVGLNSDRLSGWLAFYRSRAMARGEVGNTGAAALDTAGPNLFGRPRSHMYELWFPSLDGYEQRPIILVADEPEQFQVRKYPRSVGPIQEMTSATNGRVTWRIFYRVLGPEQPPEGYHDG